MSASLVGSEMCIRDSKQHSGFRVFRHHPGPGSVAMQVFVRSRVAKFVRNFKWLGRCGALRVLQHPRPDCVGINLCVLFVHGAHGDLLADTLHDLRTLIRCRPLRSQCVVMGDFNVDLLPTAGCDPWRSSPGRTLHHRERRSKLAAWCEACGLKVVMPMASPVGPGGSCSELCCRAPISRIPMGDQGFSCLPSLLDYACASGGV
eukprot:9905780-Alexandrium_andersonii.AAC.1